MHSYQETEITFPMSFRQSLQTISVVWNRISKRFRESRDAARQERVFSELAPHLRHDVGEIDYRPPLPRPLSETLKSHQQTPETMWLRYL